MFCPECGKEIRDASKFCIKCGYLIESGAVEETPIKDEKLVSIDQPTEENPTEKTTNEYRPTPNAGTPQKKSESLLSIIQENPIILGVIILVCGVVLYFIFYFGGSENDHPKSSVETVVSAPPPDPLKVLSETPPSKLRPDSELYDIFKYGSDHSDVQRENMIGKIKGSIVLWTLPVYEVYKKDYGYEITTSNSKKDDLLGFTKYVSTEIHLSPRDSYEREEIETLKKGDMIEIKGKIKGLTRSRSIIIDPCILPNKFDQKEIPVSKEEMGQVDTVELKEVASSDETVKIIKRYGKTDPDFANSYFYISMFDINNDGKKDILYTYAGISGSCGNTWEILINKGNGKYVKSKYCIPCTGLKLDFSHNVYKGMRIPYHKGVEQKYGD